MTSERLVEAFSTVGTPDQCLKQIRAYRETSPNRTILLHTSNVPPLAREESADVYRGIIAAVGHSSDLCPRDLPHTQHTVAHDTDIGYRRHQIDLKNLKQECSCMATNAMGSVFAAGSVRSAGALAQRPSLWFIPWALFGAAWCALIVYMATGWVSSDDFYRVVPTGPDIPPGWMVLSARIIEIISVSCSALVIYKFLIKPWRQTGEISGDGILMLACATMYVQDFWCNYFGYFCQLSSVFISWGSWANFVPGWISPNHSRLPEAPVAWGLCYGSWFVLLPMIYGGKAMSWLRAKYPRMSNLEMFAVSFLAFTAAWFCVEAIFLRTGMYAYGVAIEPLTLWYGKYYQYPIYEFVMWGLCYTIFASLYLYRDDRGLTFVEKGIDKLKMSGGKKKLMRFFALTGFLNIVFLFLWSIPMSLTTLWGGALPKDMPSFLVNDLCGPGTNYDCPAPEVPLARRTSLTNRTVVAEQLPVAPVEQARRNRVQPFGE